MAVSRELPPPPQLAPPAVDTHRLSKLFATTPALLRVDLRVLAGTICALVGANGAGKTTLLRILAGSLRPTSGAARVLGHDLPAVSVRRLIDFLPGSGAVYPDLTASENLRFALRMRRLAVADAEIAEALARAGLAATGDDVVRTYSSGMVRRVHLARLVLTRPELALLDEPYSGLDADGRDLVDELLDEARRDGRTAIVASHEQERLAALADQTVRLERGLVVDVTMTRRSREPLSAIASD